MTLEAEVPGELEDGDTYCCATGEHIGSVDSEKLHMSPRNALHLQIFHNGHWMIYHLTAIEKLGEEDAAGKDQADSTER